MPVPKPRDMFGVDDSTTIASRFDEYVSELNKSISSPVAPPGSEGMRGRASQPEQLASLLGSADITKALGADLVESVRSQMASSDLVKDLSLTNPLSTGLVAYDLEAPAKLLAPRPTPLRNRIPRKQGVGTAHQFKVISGFTGTGTGGVGLIRPGITDSTTTTFGSVPFLRGPKISYAGYDVSLPYKQFSVSDQVPWSAQFSGQGYQDIRQLSQTSVLYASMLLEEREILGGRGTSAGFGGATAAPTGVSAAARSAAGTEVGLSGITTNVYVKVTAESIFGESVLSPGASVAATNGQVVDVTITGIANGTTGLRVYVGTGASDPGDASKWFAIRGSANVITLQGALPTTGATAANVTTNGDTSGAVGDYDGILSWATGASSGYVNRTNAVLNAANPGTEFFKAFDVMYQNNKADPDEILCNGSDRRQMSDLLKTSSSSNYRITIANDAEAHGAQIGSLVTGLQNEVTGKMVDLTVHPWMPQGIMPIISWTLPIPDSNVSDVFAIFNVQDYMSVQWPVTQFAYETSSYWYGTLVCYAPGWCGAITGIKAT